MGIYIINIDLLFQFRNFTLLNAENHSFFSNNLSITSLSGAKIYSLKYVSEPERLLN